MGRTVYLWPDCRCQAPRADGTSARRTSIRRRSCCPRRCSQAGKADGGDRLGCSRPTRAARCCSARSRSPATSATAGTSPTRSRRAGTPRWCATSCAGARLRAADDAARAKQIDATFRARARRSARLAHALDGEHGRDPAVRENVVLAIDGVPDKGASAGIEEAKGVIAFNDFTNDVVKLRRRRGARRRASGTRSTS
jgi:hypothetical protein